MKSIPVQETALKSREQLYQPVQADPIPAPWQSIDLPDTWPDKLNIKNPIDLAKLISLFIKPRKRKVEIAENLIGRDRIPKYILQEFHNLPNGNYSNNITRGYTRGFDFSMLGKMKKIRPQLASWLSGLESVLDVGCAGGQMSNALKQTGIPEVWGLDPSPYLLKHAATNYPEIKFIQGVAEQTGFPNQRFSGLSACFLMHELPPSYGSLALKEFNRVLKPNGLLVICEPSSIQYDGSWLSMLFRYGLSGLYFKYLAQSVFEPFVNAWHKQDIVKTLQQHGFQIIKNDRSMPTHNILAKKVVECI